MSDSTSVTDSEKWTEGDFTLISADGVRFRVASRTLFAARYATQCRGLTEQRGYC